MAKKLKRIRKVQCPRCNTYKLLRRVPSDGVATCDTYDCRHVFKVDTELLPKPNRIRMIYCPHCNYFQPKERKVKLGKDEVQISICLNPNCLLCFETAHARTELVENPYP